MSQSTGSDGSIECSYFADDVEKGRLARMVTTGGFERLIAPTDCVE
jgi:hypothetical protein